MAETRTETKRETGARATAEPKEETASAPHVCPVAFCPIGAALSVVQGAAPDVVEHLLASAREFLLAAKAAVDARAGDFDGGRSSSKMERIEIG